MEMTTRRWVAAVAVACALLAALKLPPNGMPVRDFIVMRGQPEQHLAAVLKSRLRGLSEHLNLLARRDTLLASAIAPRTRPALVVTTPLSPAERAEFEERVATQASAIGNGARTLVLGVVRDSSDSIGRGVSYRTQRQFILPEGTDGERCVAIVKLGLGRREMDESEAAGVFGPCAFHAAFGPPGTAIEAWLGQRGYDVAFNAKIQANAQANPGFLAVRKLTREEELKRWLDFSRGYMPRDVTGCASGDVELCARSMRGPAGRRPSLLATVAFSERYYRWDEYPLGGATAGFLADLLAEKGGARFEKFWKSSADLETAFRSAFGESTGEWTMRWMQYRYGRDTRGPLIASRSALMSLLVSLGMVGVSAALAYRREAV